MKHLLFAPLRNLNLPRKIYRHMHFHGIVDVKVDKQHSFRIHHEGFQDENDLYWAGISRCWEKESFKLWIALCKLKKNSIIFDAGANHGIFSLVARSVNPTSQIFAFEPVPQIFKRLNANISLNQFPITAEPFAVSDLNGQSILHIPQTDHSYSASLDPNFSGLTKDSVPVSVKTVSLSEYRKEKGLPRVDLLKIDIEGYEPQALKGFTEDLKNFLPDLLVEVLSDEIGAEIENILEGKNYFFFNIDEISGPKRTLHIRKSFKYNYLICQRETALALGLDISL